MATTKIDKSKLKNLLPKKGAIVKKASTNNIEAAVKEIHGEDDKPIRITLDLPTDGIYKPMKRHIVDTEQTIKDYIISLIAKDLDLKSKK